MLVPTENVPHSDISTGESPFARFLLFLAVHVQHAEQKYMMQPDAFDYFSLV